MEHLRSRLGLLAAISCVLGVLGSFTILERKVLARLGELAEWKETLSERAFRLLQQNNDLRAQIVQFRRDDHHLEGLARTRLTLVRDREIVYRFLDPDETETRSAKGEDP